VIVLDTHVWVWWVAGVGDLTENQISAIRRGEREGIGVSAISCWEVAKLVELGRLQLDRAVEDWLDLALSYPGARLLGLTPIIAAKSTSLPGNFHRDPADQIIVATALNNECALVTSDGRIIAYEHVDTIS
jgi:PIN domain nuclease of toxin-antitoxin system